MAKVTIKDLAKMDEAQLMEKFGFKDKLENAKEEIAKLDQLDGKARTIAEERISRMFEPHVYPDEFGYIRESAIRQAKPKSVKEEMCNCSPDSALY